jgi:hypothetical protein
MNIAGQDLYYKWESLVFSSASAGARTITKDTPLAIRSLVQAELTKARLAQKARADLNGRMGRGGGATLLSLGSRVGSRFAGVGLMKPSGPPTSEVHFAALRSRRVAGPSRVSYSGPVMGDEYVRRQCESSFAFSARR